MTKKNLLLLCSTLLLHACTISNMREHLGLARNVPDEFSVVSNPPLSVPKNFTLPPVGSDASDTSMRKETLSAGQKKATMTLDKGDNFFLERAGAAREISNTDIRTTLDQEEKAYLKKSRDKNSAFEKWFPSWKEEEEDEDNS